MENFEIKPSPHTLTWIWAIGLEDLGGPLLSASWVANLASFTRKFERPLTIVIPLRKEACNEYKFEMGGEASPFQELYYLKLKDINYINQFVKMDVY